MEKERKIGLINTSVLALAAIGGQVLAQDSKPNIIYILADDMGYGDVGCFGQELIKTPFIDSIAKLGIKFTQHYAGTAVCAPTRSCIMTGQHTGHTYIRGNTPGSTYQKPIPDNVYTVAEVFKEQGYMTSCIGKWGLGDPFGEGSPLNQGFDHFFGYYGQVQAHDYYPDRLWRNLDTVHLPNNTSQEHTYSHDLMTEEALDILTQYKDTSFFIYLPYCIPHDDFEVPELGEYASTDWGDKAKILAAMITRMDTDIGRIMDTLKSLGISDNTFVMFTSDNGPTSQSQDFFNRRGGFRGIKRELYDGGIRVPTVAMWPDSIAPGIVTDHISAQWDFFATVCDILDVDKPDHVDGISMLPTLTSKDNQEQHDYLYWEFHEKKSGGTKQAIRYGDYKGVRKNMQNNPVNPIELYNIVEDKDENSNIASSNPEIVERIDFLMKQSRTESELDGWFNFALSTWNHIKGIELRAFENKAILGLNEKLQLNYDVTPADAVDKRCHVYIDTSFATTDATIDRFGVLTAGSKDGYVKVIAQSKVNETVTDTILVLVTNNPVVDVAVCYGKGYIINGKEVTTEGVYVDTLTSASNEDSLVVINLTIDDPIVQNKRVQICTGDTLYVGGANQTKTGYYHDTLVTGEGCDSIVITNLVVTTCSDIDEVNLNRAIKVSPNPSTNGGFKIAIKNGTISEHIDIRIYNLTGQIVFQKDFNYSSHEYLVNTNLNTGSYFLQIIDAMNNQVFNQKVLID